MWPIFNTVRFGPLRNQALATFSFSSMAWEWAIEHVSAFILCFVFSSIMPLLSLMYGCFSSILVVSVITNIHPGTTSLLLYSKLRQCFGWAPVLEIDYRGYRGRRTKEIWEDQKSLKHKTFRGPSNLGDKQNTRSRKRTKFEYSYSIG